MTKLRTQVPEYWAPPNFEVTDGDIEQIYNFLLEAEESQRIDRLALIIIEHRINEEQNELQRRLSGRIVYQPQKSYRVGDELVFPVRFFESGKVVAVRDASNPHYGAFQAIEVSFEGNRVREYAAKLTIEHPLNEGDGMDSVKMDTADPEKVFALHGEAVGDALATALREQDEFIRLGKQWFIKGLLAEINVGHLHLSEAVLEVSGGGPLPTPEILVHLDMPAEIPASVQEFSLNYALLQDDRFDEVAPPGSVAWYLKRLEPNEVRDVPERLVYNAISIDRALLGSQLLQIERDIDDEWSAIESLPMVQEVTLTITYPHRVAGTIPLASRTRPLFPLGTSERQLIQLVDEETGEEMHGWVVANGRYVYGLRDWYESHGVPVGAFVTLKPTDQTGRVLINVQRRRRERKEWVQMAHIEDGRLRFELKKRSIGCDYDDLMIIGTESPAAIDALFRQSSTQQRPLASLIVEIFPDLGSDGMQNAVHAKTLYSAVNLLRRVPPGVVFAELVRQPAFVSVGDQYWQFDSSKWQN